MLSQNTYKCYKCGQCCRNLNGSNLYSDLHNGDGICRYLDENTNFCLIYEKRPVLCNIDKSYEIYFYKRMSKDEFYQINQKGCEVLWVKRMTK